MQSQGFLARAGGVLFRFRSFTPVPLLLVALPLLWRSRGAASPLWLAAGLLLCVLGQALRAWVIGQVPDGTSGQNERLIATQLNTSGPYAHLRNPLYLGNLGITLGVCVAAHEPLLVALVALLFALQYRAIIAAEEAFLRGQFGAAFDAFCARVPRFWPRLRPALNSPSRPWSLRRAVRKEHNPLAAWVALLLVFHALDRAALAHRAGAALGLRSLGLLPDLWALVGLLIAYLGVKGWKHRWFSGGFAEDLRRRVRESAR